MLIVCIYTAWRGEQLLFPHGLPSGLRQQAGLCVYWVLVAVFFNVLVYLVGTSEEAEVWSSGFVLEYTLSIDNLFVFQALFRVYRTPDHLIPKALLIGVAASAMLRLIFFIIGTSLFEWVDWVRFPFGLALVITAYKTGTAIDFSPSHAEELDRDPSPVIAWAERNLPFTSKYDINGELVQWSDSPNLVRPGRSINSSPLGGASPVASTSKSQTRVFTMLLAVIVALAFVDVLFALDAVAAKVLQTHDLFINFSSSLLAMVSFRSLYFVIVELSVTFAMLKVGIAIVLAYVGIELMISRWVDIPNNINCIIILGICGLAIVASIVASAVEQRSLIVKDTEGLELPPSGFGLENNDETSPSIARDGMEA